MSPFLKCAFSIAYFNEKSQPIQMFSQYAKKRNTGAFLFLLVFCKFYFYVPTFCHDGSPPADSVA